MSEMVRRVADAIRAAANRVAADYEEYCSLEMSEEAARAAIEAMREPTESMANSESYKSGEWSRRNIEAFIDEALK